MKSCLKTLMIGLGLILLLVGALGLLAVSQAQSWAKTGVERSLTAAFGAPVAVVSASWTYGAPGIAIVGVEVANPEGFPEGAAVRCGEVRARIDPATWMSGTPEIALLEVEGAEVYVEYDLLKGSNVGTLLENAERLSALIDRGRGEDERRFVIREFRSGPAVVCVRSGMLTDRAMEIEIEPFTMQDVGADRPLTSGEVGSLVLRNVLRESVGFKGLLKPVADLLRDVAGGLGVGEPTAEDEQEGAAIGPIDPPVLE